MNQSVSKPDLPDYVVIGRITKPHGIRGAVKVEPITDDPERFKLLESVYLAKSDTEREIYQISDLQYGNKQLIISFNNIESRNDAESLRGLFIEIPRSECLPLDEGSYYYFELIGYTVKTDSGEIVGTLDDVYEYPANDMFVIHKDDKEILIPVIDEFIDNVDDSTGVITIKPVEGLLEQ